MTTGSGDRIIAIDASETMYVHTGLLGEITHHYRVYAVNKAQMKSNAQPDTRQATTDPAEPPSAPTGLTAVPVPALDGDAGMSLPSRSTCTGTTPRARAALQSPNIASKCPGTDPCGRTRRIP